MKILAIESSGPVASVALYVDGEIKTEKRGAFKVTHSETLMPLVSEVMSAEELKSVDYIAISGGPGSFTGLRIGSATAKGLGFALNKKLIHVPTLDAMAYNFVSDYPAAEGRSIVVPLMDARRSQVYTGVYEITDVGVQTLLEGCAIATDELVDKLNEMFGAGVNVLFLGDGIAPAKEIIKSKLAAKALFADKLAAEGAISEENVLQRAGSVAVLGAILAEQGKIVEADFEAPEYLRPSQAERVRAEQNA